VVERGNLFSGSIGEPFLLERGNLLFLNGETFSSSRAVLIIIPSFFFFSLVYFLGEVPGDSCIQYGI
jgi:hypothetical protein